MLLSKHKNIYSPAAWPCYYSKVKGSKVWDLDNNQYLDFSYNGVGACSLGHAHDFVDAAVSRVIKTGVMSSLNTPDEVELSEVLLSFNPWADMVRFARTGGEANAIAIRLARAFSGKDKVAICGYHGWHDWYLAANLESSSNLDQQLLEGLKVSGVPKSLSGSIVPLRFNVREDLEILKNDPNIGVFKMEVARSTPIDIEILSEIRQICTDKRIVLIFDECTSGFRQAFGGYHNIYGINPDMVMFGKALGNGYAITAVLGLREIMNKAMDTFISSTFWTEAIGPAAALATLTEMQRIQSWKILPTIGSRVKSCWFSTGRKYSIPLTIQGIDALPTFSFDTYDPLSFKTYFIEQMLELGVLANTGFYPTTAHSDEDIEYYQHSVDLVFKKIANILHNNLPILSHLKGPSCSPTFKRLT